MKQIFEICVEALHVLEIEASSQEEAYDILENMTDDELLSQLDDSSKTELLRYEWPGDRK